MSPQVLRGEPHTFASDVYGLGIIWYELLHRRAPWEAMSESELLQKKLTQPVEFARFEVSEEDRLVIGRCLSVETEKRDTLEDILAYCERSNQEEKAMFMAKLAEQKEKEALLA